MLVIGTSGYIGKALWAECSKTNPTLPILDHKNDERLRLESPKFDRLSYGFPEYRWAVVSQGISRFVDCEREKEYSYQCNVIGTLELIKQIRDKGMIPVILSSTAVFDGNTGGYTEESSLNPLNEYGRQKAVVEEALPQICGENYLILRVGKVAGKDVYDKTIISEILQQLLKGEIVRAAYDQYLTPVFLEDVVYGIRALQKIDARGVYHLCGREIWNRLDLAKSIARSLRINEHLVQSISLDDLGGTFIRAKRMNLSCEKFITATGYHPNSIRDYIEKIGDYVYASK